MTGRQLGNEADSASFDLSTFSTFMRLESAESASKTGKIVETVSRREGSLTRSFNPPDIGIVCERWKVLDQIPGGRGGGKGEGKVSLIVFGPLDWTSLAKTVTVSSPLFKFVDSSADIKEFRVDLLRFILFGLGKSSNLEPNLALLTVYSAVSSVRI